MKAPKFYRYWYYREYMFAKSVWNDDPEFSAMLTSSLTMACHSSFILYLITSILDTELQASIFSGVNPFEVLAYGSIFLGLSYVLLYRNKRWQAIVKEFENESDKQRKLGHLYLILYLFCSLLGIIPLMFWLGDVISR